MGTINYFLKGIKVLMISDEMRVDILHAVFINKNFIKACNYEKYLLLSIQRWRCERCTVRAVQ
ncbi:hypothetical protein [Clostridioides difficile]|uniref:hypothetical protein n=1 Tax=Clostridioides difficile TaxID=1496 RepID=UPI0034E27956